MVILCVSYCSTLISGRMACLPLCRSESKLRPYYFVLVSVFQDPESIATRPDYDLSSAHRKWLQVANITQRQGVLIRLAIAFNIEMDG